MPNLSKYIKRFAAWLKDATSIICLILNEKQKSRISRIFIIYFSNTPNTNAKCL